MSQLLSAASSVHHCSQQPAHYPPSRPGGPYISRATSCCPTQHIQFSNLQQAVSSRARQKLHALFNTSSANFSVQNDTQNSKMSFKRAAQNLVVCKRMMSEASNMAPRYVSPSQSLGDLNHRVSSFERVLLVWSGKFKSLADVPASVSRDTMERSRDYFRIRLNVSLVLVGIFGALMMVISGKNAHHRGDSLQKQNMEWHKKYNETHSH